MRGVLSVQIPWVGGGVGNLSGRFCGETQLGLYSSHLTLHISRGGTRELGAAGCSRAQPKQLATLALL